MRVVAATGLPADPIDAAAAFFEQIVPEVRLAVRTGDLPVCVRFAAADHTHRAWRLAAIQALAREAAPGRVNAAAGGGEAALAAALAWLDRAEGVTGQMLVLDDTGSGPVIA